MSYAVITPVRDEADNLPRLAEALVCQTERPVAWLIADNGSTDDTAVVAAELAREHDWIRLVDLPGEPGLVRGGPIASAFEAGLEALAQPVDVVVKLDADVSAEPDYFSRLLAQFAADASLGMASGSCYERENGSWRQRHVTGTSVWGASRAYRWACLREVLPLERSMGWDGIDELKANLRGWRTATFTDLPFRHHRREGERDGKRRAGWAAQGRAAYYMGYRASYLVLRSLYQATRDPAALAMISAYGSAAARREPRCADPRVRAYLRRRQSLRSMPVRLREALGRR